MDTKSLQEKIENLTPDLQKEVEIFLENLLKKKKDKKKLKPIFGSARGEITISSDFDEPIQDFNEYM
jgi:ABC-type phosphate/phosphonate transport system substrate-binding protein